MLYGGSAVAALIACIYLLLRRGNGFSADVMPPRRLRRWTALFFAFLAVGHLWYLPAARYTSDEAIVTSMLVGGLLDCVTVFPVAIIILLCMLQDRRRPLWPVGLVILPLVMIVVASIVNRSYDLLPWGRGYLLLMGLGITIYMVRAVYQYGHWLRDNFADLEHKEVWQSFVILAAIVLTFGYYSSGESSMTYEYIIQVCGILLTGFLLWRVETLQDLSFQPISTEIPEDGKTGRQEDTLSDATYEQIGALLQQHCIATQLYLQHDLTLSNMAQIIGTNRTYLSQYFSGQNTTYNTYINTLRIDHFIRLYREDAAAHRSISAQQLATRSGYRSYRTFSHAFKQRTGQSVTVWMRDADQ